MLRELLCRFMQELEGFKLIQAGATCLEVLREFKQLFANIILIEIGEELCRNEKLVQQFKKIHPSSKIIFIAGDTSRQTVEKWVSVGCNAYLHKHESIDALLEAMIQVHEKNYFFKGMYSKRLFIRTSTHRHIQTQNNLLEIQLTKRELELLQLVCKGYKYTEIAERLFISRKTVDRHCENLKHKIGTRDRFQWSKFYETYVVVKV